MMSFIDGLGEPRTTEFDVTYKDKKYHFKMKEIRGLEDESFITQFTDPLTGKLNLASLWAKRISRTLIEPKLTMADVEGSLPKSMLETLKAKWMELNQLDEKAFLGNFSGEQKEKEQAGPSS